MAKKIVQDVLPPERRSIRAIPIPGTKREKKEKTTPLRETREVRMSKPKKNQKPRKNGGVRLGIWVVAIICIAVLSFAVSFIFAGATVTITPKKQTIQIDSTVNAEKESAPGKLTYTVISVSKEGGKTVPAGGEERVEKKASGKIIIYNNYSASPQVLVKNTRFETPDGLIFRINENVTVPGYTKSNSIVLPGFIKVTVTADKAGDEYNIGLADFTIPGFKGDPRYTKFNAKSDPASKIEGGFSGVVKKVADSDKLAAKTEIETSLKDDLLEMAKLQIPSTHVLFTDMTMYTFEPLPQSDDTEKTTIIKERGVVNGILLDRKELVRFLTANIINYEDDLPVVLATNLESLNVVFSNKSSFNPATGGTVSAKINGSLNLVWDTAAKNAENRSLADELAGRKRAEIKDILSKFKSIEKAEVVIRPFWSFSFPEKTSKIKVKVAN